MNNQTIQGIADAHPSGLRIVHYGRGLVHIPFGIEISMAYSRTGLNHRHFRIFPHIRDELAAASGDNQVHQTHR